MTWDKEESSPVFSTCIVSDPSLLTEPPITSSPLYFSTGTDSPVSMDSSIADLPSTIVPSTGIFSPGFTSTRSSCFNSDNGTSYTLSFASNVCASCGMSLTSCSSALEAPITERISIQCPSNIMSTNVANSQNKLCPSQPNTTNAL